MLKPSKLMAVQTVSDVCDVKSELMPNHSSLFLLTRPSALFKLVTITADVLIEHVLTYICDGKVLSLHRFHTSRILLDESVEVVDVESQQSLVVKGLDAIIIERHFQNGIVTTETCTRKIERNLSETATSIIQQVDLRSCLIYASRFESRATSYKTSWWYLV